MITLKLAALSFMLLWLGNCTMSNSTNSNLSDKQDGQAINYKELIIGTWEGQSWVKGEKDVKMSITFNRDNTVVVDNTPGHGKGGQFKQTYEFKDERTIKMDRYPDNLTVERINDDEIEFRPEVKDLRGDINIIYLCRFTKVKN